jgi:hypothetical protein
MQKTQCRQKRKMKNQGNLTPPNLNKSTVANTNDSEVDEISKKFKKLLL